MPYILGTSESRVFHHYFYCVCALSTNRHPAYPAFVSILEARETQRQSSVVINQRHRNTELFGKVVRVPVPVIGAQAMTREYQSFRMSKSLEYHTLK